MSFDRSSAESAAADLMLGLAEVIYYISNEAIAAGALLGVAPEAFRAYERGKGESPVRDAARQTRLAGLAGLIAAYAKEGTWATGEGDFMDDLTDFEVAIELLNGKEGPCLIGPDHVWLVPEASANLLLEVHVAAQARLAIDRGSDITVPMLAALAGVSEKTIRMASNPNNDRPLKTVKDGSSTFIRSEDALEWLGRRSDFKPTRYFVSEGIRPRLGTFWSLAAHLKAVRTDRGMTIDSLAQALKWSPATAGAYSQIESARAPSDLAALQPQHLSQVAERFGIHEPVEFARENYALIAAAYGEALVKEQLP